MNARDLRIVFMGTPEFAVPSLRALVAGGYNVVGGGDFARQTRRTRAETPPERG